MLRRQRLLLPRYPRDLDQARRWVQGSYVQCRTKPRRSSEVCGQTSSCSHQAIHPQGLDSLDSSQERRLHDLLPCQQESQSDLPFSQFGAFVRSASEVQCIEPGPGLAWLLKVLKFCEGLLLSPKEATGGHLVSAGSSNFLYLKCLVVARA